MPLLQYFTSHHPRRGVWLGVSMRIPGEVVMLMVIQFTNNLQINNYNGQIQIIVKNFH